MKGEFLDQQQPNKNESSSPNMFSKLHHQHHPQQQHHHQQRHHQQQGKYALHPHHVPFQVVRECLQTSEEDDSRSSGGATPSTATPKLGSGDGASIEVVRRPRGRPPGSKNKPKPPVVITRDTEPAMSPYILEVPGGNDVVEAISRFCRRKGIGLCVLTGSGTVANVTLRQPTTTPGGTVTFHGRFDILSISATVLPPATSYPVPNGFTISLAGPQGQIVGGAVAGPLLAAGTVYVIAATFNSPSYHRLPPEEEVRNSLSGGGDGHSPPASGGGESGAGQQQQHPQQQSDSCGIGMYSCHLPSDVIWAPTARQPPPPPY